MRRIVILVGLFAALTLANLLLPSEVFLGLVLLALIGAPIVNVSAAILLIWLHRQAPEVDVLRRNAWMAVALAVGSVGIAIVALNRALSLNLPADVLLVVFAFALLVVTLPALEWLHAALPLLQRQPEDSESAFDRDTRDPPE